MFNRFPVYLMTGYGVHFEIAFESCAIRAVQATEGLLTGVDAQVGL